MGSKKLFSYETLVHALSGAAGGVTALGVFFPLDTIRSRLQVEDSRKAENTILAIQQLIEEEGISSLYRGIKPVLISLCCSNFVYFYAFHGLRSLLPSDNTGKNAMRDISFAAVAGAINVFLTTPLWVANQRLKMQGAKLSAEDNAVLGNRPHYKGLIDALTQIASQEGFKALWSSLAPSLVLVSNPAIQFTVYEAVKAEWSNVFQQKKMNGLSIFIIGALSKCISTFITYPLQLVQAKLRYGSEKMKKLTMLEVFTLIVRSNGVQGLFKGLESKLLQTTLTTALMFLCYEKIASFVFYLMGLKPTNHR